MDNLKIVTKPQTTERWFPRLKKRAEMPKSRASKRDDKIKRQPLVLVADK